MTTRHKNKVDQVKWSIGTTILALSYQDRTVQVEKLSRIKLTILIGLGLCTH